MKLLYSYVDGNNNNQEDATDIIGARIPSDHIGKGLYSSVSNNTPTFPQNIKPDADVYSQYFFDKSAVPGYTRLGNNSQSMNCMF